MATPEWLKHAFAIEPDGPADPTPPQRESLERLCRAIVGRDLATPALIFLESFRPLHSVGSQAVHFFSPFLSALGGGDAVQNLAAFLEQRGSVDYICRLLFFREKDRYASGAVVY